MSGEVSKGQQLAGQGAIILAVALWSTAGLTIKLLDWHPLAITCARSTVAAIFLFVVRLISPPSKTAKKNKPLPLWAAGSGYALMMISFVIANKITTAANSILLLYTAPVWATLLAWWLLSEKPRWEHWGALALIAVGFVLFFREALGAGSLLGDGVAALSGIFFGAYAVFLRQLKDGTPRDAMLLAHIICAVISSPFIIMYPPSFSPSSFLLILYMGSLQMGAGALFFSYGIQRINTVQAMCTAILEPILNPVWVLLKTGEKPSLSALAGGAVIIFAVVASSLIGIKREERQAEKTG